MWHPHNLVARTVHVERNRLGIAEHVGQCVRVAVHERIGQRIRIRWHRHWWCWRLGFRVAVRQRARIGHTYHR
jgi:hypothetical protein